MGEENCYAGTFIDADGVRDVDSGLASYTAGRGQ
jgi:hypothetical protein